MKTLITDGFADDEWCEADDLAVLHEAVHRMIMKALDAQRDSRQKALMLEPRTLDQLRTLPLWKTRLRIVIDHTHVDNQYVETIEGVLGNISWGASHFRVCIGGHGLRDEGRWVSLMEYPFTHSKVSVFEVMS